MIERNGSHGISLTINQVNCWLKKLAPSSSAKRTPPTGAPKARRNQSSASTAQLGLTCSHTRRCTSRDEVSFVFVRAEIFENLNQSWILSFVTQPWSVRLTCRSNFKELLFPWEIPPATMAPAWILEIQSRDRHASSVVSRRFNSHRPFFSHGESTTDSEDHTQHFGNQCLEMQDVWHGHTIEVTFDLRNTGATCRRLSNNQLSLLLWLSKHGEHITSQRMRNPDTSTIAMLIPIHAR